MGYRWKYTPVTLAYTGCSMSHTGTTAFMPEPHLRIKLKILTSSELIKPVDVFDILLHATPWLLLIIKLVLLATNKRKQENPS